MTALSVIGFLSRLKNLAGLALMMTSTSYSPDTERRAVRMAELIIEQGLTPKQAAERENVSVSTVSRLYRIAKDKGIVKRHVERPDSLQVEPEVTTDALNTAGNALEERFCLRRGIVVPVPKPFFGAEDFTCALDDKLSASLGLPTARYVGTLVRSDDIIGIGGGRSSHFAAEHMRSRDRETKQLTIVSLAGGLGVYEFADGPKSVLSADGSAALLAQTLNASRIVRRGDSLYQRAGSRLRFLWNVDDSGATKPNIALIGVGAITKQNHTCFSQLRHELDDEGRRLAEEIVGMAEVIRHKIDQLELPSPGNMYFPVADVLSRPFFVEPPTEIREGLGERSFARLKDDIESMSDRVYAATLDQLASIDHVVVVAGGVRKAHAIHHIMMRVLETRSNPWRHSLVTDIWTANQLLAISDTLGA